MKPVPNIESAEKVAVRYVGSKTLKYDTVCHTRTVWYGEGDVQLVPIAVATQLARFPSVWEIVQQPDRKPAPDHGDPGGPPWTPRIETGSEPADQDGRPVRLPKPRKP